MTLKSTRTAARRRRPRRVLLEQPVAERARLRCGLRGRRRERQFTLCGPPEAPAVRAQSYSRTGRFQRAGAWEPSSAGPLCSAFARARPVSILHTRLPWAILLSKPQAGFTFGLGAPGRFWGDVISVFGHAEDRTRRSRGLRHQGATVQGAPGYRGATSASSGALLEVLKKCPNRAQKGDCQYCPPRGPLDDAPTRPPPPLTEGRRHRVLLWAGRARPGGHLFPKPCDHGVLRRPS